MVYLPPVNESGKFQQNEIDDTSFSQSGMYSPSPFLPSGLKDARRRSARGTFLVTAGLLFCGGCSCDASEVGRTGIIAGALCTCGGETGVAL